MEEKLISAVCDLPELYNINLKSYNDLRAKSNAWRSVAKATGMPEDKCKKKWKNLRDTYRREVKRTGANGGPNKWKHSSLLSFLDPFMKELAAGGSMEDGFPPHCSPVSPQSGSDQEQTSPLLQAGPNAAPRRTLRKKAERGGGGGGSNSDEWFEEYAMSVLNKQPDAEESFLLSLAPMLKALPPEKRSLAKIELLTVLHKLQFTPEPTT